jgi:hypothetical protein
MGELNSGGLVQTASKADVLGRFPTSATDRGRRRRNKKEEEEESMLAIPRDGCRMRCFSNGVFISSYKADNRDPVILELNGHYSHTRNLEVITLV